MELEKMREDLSVRAKNGIGFIFAAIIIWSIITWIYLCSMDILTKNILMLMSTGLMFPLSVGLSTILKADWKLTGHPLGQLGFILNIAQIIYFPILILVMIQHPEEAIIVFAMITGAHLFPYGWLYKSLAYAMMAPLMTMTFFLLSFFVTEKTLAVIPSSMVFMLIVMTVLLRLDYRRKIK